MKLGTEPSPASQELHSADSATSTESNDSHTTSSCSKEYQPVQLLSWNIEELGGGTSEPMVRESVLIDAYAKLIAGLELDVVVVLDVRWGRKYQIRQGKLEDGSPYLYYEDAKEDTGPAELDRILEALGKADSAGGWELLVPDEGGVIYDRGSTVGIFYKTQDGLSVADQGLAQAWEDPAAGIGGLVAWVTFDVPVKDDFEAWQVTVAAPLNVMADHDLPAKDASEDDKEPTLKDLPDAYVLALSWSEDRSGTELSGLRNKLKLFGPAIHDGTVLHRPYWEVLVEENECLIDNAVVLNPANVWVHDEYMNWKALTFPEHPDELHEVLGVLADQVLSRYGSSEHPPWIRELRVVDLVRATLATDSKVFTAGADAPSGASESSATDTTAGSSGEASDEASSSDALPEDGLLVDALTSYLKLKSPLVAEVDEDDDESAGGDSQDSGGEVDPDAAYDISASYALVRRLSDHWPLLAVIQPYS